MNDTPLYSIRIIKIYIEYINKQYPGIDIEPILEYAGITTHQMEDAGYWLTQDQVDRFYEIVVRKTDNANIAREAGRYSTLSKAGLPVQQYALGFITPATAYTVMEKLYNQVSRA
ncbi:MAG: phosphohydrolase, partial [Deltaproteobacteria bacterium]|nr:phosphohydrolase [Deltaproteobacteria bacterium]